jgi:selenide,water dikinase
MNGVSELAADGMLPAGCYRNRDHYLPLLDGTHRDSDALLALFDPQTSGGLLIALAPEDADRFMTSADGLGIFARRIGDVLPLQAHFLEVP